MPKPIYKLTARGEFAGNGYIVEYSKPTEFITKVTNQKQVELLDRILDNAGVKK